MIIFLYEEQGKVVTDTTTFWLVVACCVSHSMEVKHSLISNKTRRNQLISLFFAMRQSSSYLTVKSKEK